MHIFVSNLLKKYINCGGCEIKRNEAAISVFTPEYVNENLTFDALFNYSRIGYLGRVDHDILKYIVKIYVEGGEDEITVFGSGSLGQGITKPVVDFFNRECDEKTIRALMLSCLCAIYFRYVAGEVEEERIKALSLISTFSYMLGGGLEDAKEAIRAAFVGELTENALALKAFAELKKLDSNIVELEKNDGFAPMITTLDI